MVGLIAIRRVIQDWDLGIKRAQLLAELDASAVRQADIEDVEIEIDFSREFEALRNASRCQNAVAAILQKRGHHQARVLVIVNMKNAGFGAFHGRSEERRVGEEWR